MKFHYINMIMYQKYDQEKEHELHLRNPLSPVTRSPRLTILLSLSSWSLFMDTLSFVSASSDAYFVCDSQACCIYNMCFSIEVQSRVLLFTTRSILLQKQIFIHCTL